MVFYGMGWVLRGYLMYHSGYFPRVIGAIMAIAGGGFIVKNFALVFLPAVGDFVSAQLLGGPNTYMIGNLIQQQFFGAENWPFGAALTTLMMLFLMVWMIFYLRSAARAAREAVVA